MKKLLLLVLCCVTLQQLRSQSDSSAPHVDSAVLYLTGSYKKYDPIKSLSLFQQRANAGDAKAMNAVALHYVKGLGVDTNSNMAAYWFRKAAVAGYKKAWVNLGMMHKRNSSDSAGYATALAYFDTALQQQEPSAFFAAGYMYYKGLGCNQSYATALSFFRQGVMIGRADCMYFTGLCYKYGYGVTANEDSATWYIDIAARKGYKQANAELASASGTTATRSGNPLSAPVLIQPLEKAAEEFKKPTATKQYTALEGIYTGSLTEYDYSGKLIVRNIPLALKLNVVGNRLQGQWEQQGNEVIQIEAVQTGNSLRFSASNYIMAAVKAKARKQKLLFKTAVFDAKETKDSVYLHGSLVLYNTLTRETERPINLRLARLREPKQEQTLKSSVVVYPNPVSKSFTVSFKSEKPAVAKVKIYNANGQLVYTAITGELQRGTNRLVIDKDLGAAGIYIVHISLGGKQESTAFVKE